MYFTCIYSQHLLIRCLLYSVVFLIKTTTTTNFYFFLGITLNIRNIDDEIDTEILHQAFSRFGTVLKAKIISELNKKRYGTVSFLSPADAANAISNMNGRVIISKTLYVSLDAPRTKQRRPSNPSMQRFAGLYKVLLSI